MATLYRSISNPSSTPSRAALKGHLCRCTGYRPIHDVFEDVRKNPVPHSLPPISSIPRATVTSASYFAPLTLEEAEGYLADNPSWSVSWSPLLDFHRDKVVCLSRIDELRFIRGREYGAGTLIEDIGYHPHLQRFGTPNLRAWTGLGALWQNTDVSPLFRAVGATARYSPGGVMTSITLPDYDVEKLRVLTAGPSLDRQITVVVNGDKVEGSIGAGRHQFSLSSVHDSPEGVFPEGAEESDKANWATLIRNAVQYKDGLERSAVVGTQETHEAAGSSPPRHLSALKHASGSAQFCDDLVGDRGTLHAAHVTSRVARGRIISIDPKGAKFFDARDVAPLPSRHKAVTDDTEKLFATRYVRCVGEVIGLVVAETRAEAEEAARRVVVNIEPMDPEDSLYPYDHSIASGVVDEEQHTLSGSVEMGGQHHWYLEPHALTVVPQDGGEEITVHSCTQCVMKSQNAVAGVLNLPVSAVNISVQRIGGGFGGKETLSTFTAARLAVAAHALNRPVRILMDRETDSQLNGGRHPFSGSYSASADGSGRITSARMRLRADGGATASTTKDVMDRALCHSTNSYQLPNFAVSGKCRRTSRMSNTAYRGFGAPQSGFVVEDMIDRVACDKGLSPEQVREANMTEGPSETAFGQMYESHIRQMWNHCKKSSGFDQMRKDVKEFNSTSVQLKRGLAMIPTTYGIAFPVDFLNAGSAYVRLYLDGSVLVTHSATEMGQGVNVKMASIVSRALGVALDQVKVGASSSSDLPNCPPTAASVGSDLSGGAVLDGCTTLADRLRPYRREDRDFGATVKAAYLDRVPLHATGYYKVPWGATYDWDKRTGDVYSYFTFGVAASCVEVDTLTGMFRVLQSDVLMDVGKSLNSAIDVGQIEGAFVQGVGLFTCEEVRFDEKGALLSTNADTYKVPDIDFVPEKFNVELWPHSPNPRAVHSSRAVGEPPLFLSYSVYAAIKDAIYSARGSQEYFRLDSPATQKRILAAINKD